MRRALLRLVVALGAAMALLALTASPGVAAGPVAAPRPPGNVTVVGMAPWWLGISHHVLSWTPSPDDAGAGQYRARYTQVAPGPSRGQLVTGSQEFPVYDTPYDTGLDVWSSCLPGGTYDVSIAYRLRISHTTWGPLSAWSAPIRIEVPEIF